MYEILSINERSVSFKLWFKGIGWPTIIAWALL
jgi:hypothetical protein